MLLVGPTLTDDGDAVVLKSGRAFGRNGLDTIEWTSLMPGRRNDVSKLSSIGSGKGMDGEGTKKSSMQTR